MSGKGLHVDESPLKQVDTRLDNTLTFLLLISHREHICLWQFPSSSSVRLQYSQNQSDNCWKTLADSTPPIVEEKLYSMKASVTYHHSSQGKIVRETSGEKLISKVHFLGFRIKRPRNLELQIPRKHISSRLLSLGFFSQTFNFVWRQLLTDWYEHLTENKLIEAMGWSSTNCEQFRIDVRLYEYCLSRSLAQWYLE